MDWSSRWWDDLGAVAVLTVAASAVVALDVSWTPLRVLVGLPLVLFLPGYALVSALFPETETHADGDPAAVPRSERRLDRFDRVMLSFVSSLGLVSTVTFLLNFTPFGIRLTPILVGIGGLTLSLTFVGLLRRAKDSPDRHVRIGGSDAASVAVLVASPVRILRARVSFRPRLGTLHAPGVLLAVSVLVFAGAIGYAAMAPPEGERFTELYVLHENEEGDLVAGDFPDVVAAGETQPVHVVIENHEGAETAYTTVVTTGPADAGSDGDDDAPGAEIDPTGTESERISTTVADGDAETTTYEIRPDATGDRRISFLLYRGEPPETPTVDNAYRTVHVRFSVTE